MKQDHIPSLKEAISIEGTLLMLDGATPHVAVPVQVIHDGKVIATTLSDERGRYQLTNLEPGQYQLRCQVLGGYVYYRATDHALRFTFYDSGTTEPAMEDDSGDILHIKPGKSLDNIDFRFAPFKKGTWRNYDTMDGLAHNAVRKIYRDPDGMMWFATEGGGVSRYDGKEFTNFTAQDGLAGNIVADIYRDPDGTMWFGTSGGVSRYDGRGMGHSPHFVNFFEAASGGTVLLDEISEMPQNAQIHLLRVLEERKVRRLGENVSRDVDVRIIAMTNKDLIKEGKAGRFREDLYYRLSEFPIRIPPLRERTEDISLLAEHFLHEYSQEQKKELDGFAPGVFEALQSYPWPGNVRELRNFIRAAATLAEEGRQIQIYHFPTEVTQGESLIQEFMQTIGQKTTRYRELVDRFERRCIEHALGVCKGNRTQAAKMLGIDRRSLYEKMDRLGIDIPANISDPPENK